MSILFVTRLLIFDEHYSLRFESMLYNLQPEQRNISCQTNSQSQFILPLSSFIHIYFLDKLIWLNIIFMIQQIKKNRRCYSCCRWHYRFCYWQTFCLCLCLVHCATQKTFQYLYCCTNTNGTLENGREKKGGWFDHLDMKALGKKNKKNNKTIVDRKSWIRSIHIVWSFNFSFTARFMGTHHIYIGIFQETITLSDKMRMGTSGKEQKYSRQQRNQKKIWARKKWEYWKSCCEYEFRNS